MGDVSWGGRSEVSLVCIRRHLQVALGKGIVLANSHFSGVCPELTGVSVLGLSCSDKTSLPIATKNNEGREESSRY